MIKKAWLAACLLIFALAVFLLCTNPQNPFDNPGNAKFSLVFKDSKGLPGADLAVSDTVGKTIKIGVCPYLSKFIDSVAVTVFKFQNNSDSVYVLKDFSSDNDTIWNSFTFTKVGTWNISAKAFIQGDKYYILTGEITIYGQIITATIMPSTESRSADSMAAFSVTATGDAPFTYQWFHDATSLPGEVNITFIRNHLTFLDSGNYTCVVHDKWGDSTVTSAAVLSVTPKVKVNTKPILLINGHPQILSTGTCSLTVSVTDPDSGQTHTFTVVKAPSGYSFAGNLFTWTPPANYLGTDSSKSDTVVFSVTDNGVPPLSDTQKMTIVVTAKILAPDSIKGLAAVSRINGSFVFLWNKSANADQYQIFRSKDTTGFVLYTTTPDTFFANAINDTPFYYYVIAANSKGTSAPSARIRSTVINTAPKWSHDTISVSVNEAATIFVNLADSCKDTNGDAITLSLVTGGPAFDSLVGTTWKYTPSYTDSGSFTVKIKAWDGIDSSFLAIKLHVVNVPRPPQPQSQSLSTNRNTALPITLAAIDPDGDAITSWVIDTAVTHGTTSAVSINGGVATLTYTPANGFIGSDYFTFKAAVGSLSSAYSARVAIRVDTNNIAPVISQKLAAKTLNKGDSLVLSVTINSDAFPAPKFYWYKTSAPALDSTSISSWKKLALALSDSGYYYVIVKNVAGQDSSGAKVTMQCAPVISPKLAATTTVNAGSTTPVLVLVNADATPSPTYQWYFNGQPITTNGTSSSYSKTWAIADTGTYKVIVSNAAGKDSSFTKLTVTPVPGTPTLVSPANNAINVVVAPTLTWNTVTGATTYRVQVSTVNTFATLFTQDSTLTVGSKAISGLANGTKYFWRVNATNAAGTSAWATDSFTTIVAVPATPVLTAPADNATNVAIAPTLTWNTVTGAATYRVQVSTANTFATILTQDSTLTTGSKAISGLSNSTRYFWRVNATNAGGTSAWVTDSFITIITIPSTPTLVSPADGASGIPVSPMLVWNKDAGTAVYYISIATDTDFSSSLKIDSTTTMTDTSKTFIGLVNGTTYYWRVQAKNAGGTSPYSTRRSFRIIRQFSLIANGINGTVTKTPDLAEYDSGSVVGLKAHPGSGYDFASWSGVTSSTFDSATVIINSPKTVVANFIKTFELTVIPGTGGTITVPASSTVVVDSNSATTITAAAISGYTFANWTVSSGSATITNASSVSTTVKLSGNTTVTANFAQNYTVTFDGQGATTLPNPSTKTVIYPATTVGTLPVDPARTSFVFAGWWTEKDGNGTQFKVNTSVINDITVYAKWVIMDKSGNIYDTIKIGNQVWMMENLKTNNYNDSTLINFVTDSATWCNSSTQGFCWYDNSYLYPNDYGFLYNWNAVNSGKLAPAGWHIPTDSEWSVLVVNIGSVGADWMAGGALKEVDTFYWAPPNTGATNSTGFSARGGGSRDDAAAFSEIKTNGYWWSATEADNLTAWLRSISYSGQFLGRSNVSKKYGCSVRCIRNY
jgi:uncharacterized protein (TIGR02145 family)/uncharacterized repeat protein (TIGR02543 family)